MNKDDSNSATDTSASQGECGFPTGILVSEDGLGISIHVDGLDAEEARQVAGAVYGLADRLTPASPDGLAALEHFLDIFNDIRGVSLTLDDLATMAGVDDIRGATMADEHKLAICLGKAMGQPLA